ncbi:MAG: aldehyde dehydrogenase family protein, partial [Woeseiaceae bacterium]
MTAKDPTASIAATMTSLGKAAKQAATELATTPGAQRNAALSAAATALRERAASIVEANALDLGAAREKKLSAALLDRLMLDADRVEAMAVGLETIIGLHDPVGRILEEWERPNGLRIQRVAVPLGVIGIIYESRPNVTADAAALCIKSGNAVILR